MLVADDGVLDWRDYFDHHTFPLSRRDPSRWPHFPNNYSIGAEEDSFGKDEIVAVHTRNRVQEIVGAAQYLHKRSGSMLPSPVDDHLNSRSAPSFEEPVFSSGLKDVAYAAVASGDHKDRIVKSSKHTTFVDIVGRSCNSGSDKDVDVNSVTEGQMLNLCSDMSSVCVNTSSHANDEGSDLVSIKSPTPEQSISGVVTCDITCAIISDITM